LLLVLANWNKVCRYFKRCNQRHGRQC